MVSFWPWKVDDSSPASFEKALSALSVKISNASGKLDSLRQRSRRLSVLWTLYAGFAYLLYTIILVLVVGWTKWGLVEYAAVAGGPVIIYLVRLGLSNYYDYRTSNIQTQLDGLQKQRDATIEKLKTATKFNSTQELLKKYGGTPTPKAKSAEASVRKITPKHKGPSEGSRTSFVPPPTANIPGRDGPPSLYTSPQASAPQARKPPGQQIVMLPEHSPRPSQAPVSPIDHSAEFAPNAFSAPVQYAQDNEGPRWYDRLMDVLLGEDETRPGARLALICSQCRLVNGQAPPGVKILEDLGKWRCGGCGAMNGEESEVKKIVSSIKIASKEDAPSEKESGGSGVPKSHNKNGDDGFTPATEDQESDVTQYSTDESEKEEKHEKTELKRDRTLSVAEHDTPRRRSTRHTKGKKAG